MRKSVKDTKENVKRVKTQKKKISLKTKVIIGSLLFVVVFIVAIKNYINLGLIINKNITDKDVVLVELESSNNQVYGFKDGVLVYSKDKIVNYNKYGKKKWSISLSDMVNSQIQTSGDYIQILNKDKNIVYVFKNEYELARIKLDSKINSATIDKKGTSLIEYSSNNFKTAIGVYDKKGTRKYNIKIDNSIIGKYCISEDYKYLAYASIDTKGISLNTKINILNLKEQKESANDTEIINIDNLLAYDMFWNSKNLVVRTDEKYIIYDMNTKKINEVKIGSGSFSNIGDYKDYYAYTGIDSSGKDILTISKFDDLDSKKTVILSDIPKYFIYDTNISFVCFQNKIEIYNKYGVNVKNYSTERLITKPVIFNNGKSIAMPMSNKLIMFTI